MNMITEFKSYSTKKKIFVSLGLLWAFSALIGAFTENTAEKVAERDAFIATSKANQEKFQAEQLKLAAELSGRKCTKDGNAMIGEEPDRTLKCGWGKPRDINRTTHNNFVREQWVYDGGNYLYFTNGKLTAIQN